ncbi:MAG: MAE_28990/MAE_18760 family HEPN-like nuclease [Chloroflexota bacterium]|nr:MAE_28990/MAE_18760 family HEPN-like nuclease [Chloroflexota bacterium]
MHSSNALLEFEDSLKMVEELLKIEKKYDNPPRLKDQKAVQGLRGGAVILMVAAFENFLRRTISEHLRELTVHPKVSFDKLPPRMKVNCVFLTLDNAMKGPPSRGKVERLPDIERACQLVLSETINPDFFTDTKSNPNAKNVKSIFLEIGLEDIFDQVKNTFDRIWKKPIHQTFIEDKLDEIINRRHRVAHTADTLQITRSDLNESIKFLKILSSVLDSQLKKHISAILKSRV